MELGRHVWELSRAVIGRCDSVVRSKMERGNDLESQVDIILARQPLRI
jgi:hypothetical protein